MKNNTNNNQKSKSNISFWVWLKGIFTMKISKNSNGVLKLGPRWLLLGLLSLGNIRNQIANESLFWVFMELIFIFLLGGLIWYGLDRLRGKTKIQ